MSKYCINFVGDSLSFTSFSHTYQSVNKAAASVYGETSIVRKAMRVWPSADVIAANYALSGYRLTDLITQAAEVDGLINSDYTAVAGRPERHYILVVLIGSNVSDANPTTFAASVGSFCLARQAAGHHVLLGTLPDRGDGVISNFNSSYSAPYNAIIKGTGWAAANGVSGIIDFAADAEIGDAGASSNLTYFDSFKIHPNAAANSTFMGPRTKAAINALITALGGTAQLP